MMQALSERQTQLLKAIIDEYIETAEPVGSVSLEKKYNLGVSPATIRNEMSALTSKGFLRQPHTSAGRTPTPLAMKFYINQLMDEKTISVTDEVQAKESVWDSRDNVRQLMREATQALSSKTNSLAVACLDDGSVWAYGHSYLFENPEFYDYNVARSILSMIEETKRVQKLFFEHLTGRTSIEVLFGEELGWDFFEPVSVVASRFQIGEKQGAIGIVGPARIRYANVIPMVRYFGRLITEITSHE